MDYRNWLKEQIAHEAGIKEDEVSLDEEFSAFKLDSLSLITVTFELENTLDKEIDPSVFTEYNTINKLAEWLENQN